MTQPGPEVDARIAVEVMGWTKLPGDWREPIWVPPGYPDCIDSIASSDFCPSTSIADAWQVVEKMRSLGFGCHITAVSDLSRTRHFWAVDFNNPHAGQGGHEHDTESAPLAICLAALASVKGDSK
jgi:hypothetical protein